MRVQAVEQTEVAARLKFVDGSPRRLGWRSWVARGADSGDTDLQRHSGAVA